MLKRTPLYDFHISCGAKMVEYAGWEMPIYYRGIVEEHKQTRQSGSLFDVSHMGRIQVTGPGALPLLEYVLTRNVSQIRVGQSRYSLVCNPAGGVRDDVIVSKHPRHWLVVCNGANHDIILDHLTRVRDEKAFEAEISDKTDSTAMVAVQGPAVIDIISDVLEVDVKAIKRYGFENGTYMMSRFTLFRSGYTGEDGVEVIVSTGTAQNMVESMSSEMSKPDAPIKPAGLGARDTLRLEAGMPLHGHELSESIDPISAGLAWAVDLGKEFIGRDPLRVIAEKGPAKKLVGLQLEGQRIARQGSPVKSGSATIGEITSGTFSPTLQRSIAMAYVDAAKASEGGSVEVDLRTALIPATITPLPFYKRTK
jgi:aminomethyltransferase